MNSPRSLYESFPTNLPIPDGSFESLLEKAGNTWNKLTELAILIVIENPKVAEIVAPLASTELNQTVPNQFIKLINESIVSIPDKQKRLWTHLINRSGLQETLNLPIIPEERIGIDVGNTPSAQNLFDSLNFERETGSENNSSAIQQIQESRYLHLEEKKTLFMKYKMGRDVLMLSLVAQLSLLPTTFEFHDGTEILPNGIHIHIAQKVIEDFPQLCDFNSWRRMQHKDRMYILSRTTDKRQPILVLKETKTSRHRDNTRWRDRTDYPFLSDPRRYDFRGSVETEFNVGQELQKYSGVYSNFKLTFEKPLGYVKFPRTPQNDNRLNDYKHLDFGIYIYEEGMHNFGDSYFLIRDYILGHSPQFDEEYTEVKNVLHRQRNHRTVFGEEFIPFRKIEELSFDQFAKAKARCTSDLLSKIVYTVTNRLEWKNQDKDGVGIRINSEGIPELIFFDYERYAQNSRFDALTKDSKMLVIDAEILSLQTMLENGIAEKFSFTSSTKKNNVVEFSAVERAAYLAITEHKLTALKNSHYLKLNT